MKVRDLGNGNLRLANLAALTDAQMMKTKAISNSPNRTRAK